MYVTTYRLQIEYMKVQEANDMYEDVLMEQISNSESLWSN